MKRALQKKPREAAKAVFRNAILDAAEDVFAERGLNGTRMQDIAARARIAVGTVYNHFPTKEDMIAALLEERSAEMLAELTARAGEPVDFQRRLSERIRRALAFIDRHRGYYSVLFGVGQPVAAGMHGKSIARVQKLRGVLRALISMGHDAGAVDRSYSTDHLASLLLGIIRSFAIDALMSEETGPLEEHADTIAQFFLHGCARRRK